MPSAAPPAAAGARLADVQKLQNNVKTAAHAMIDGRFIVIRPPNFKTAFQQLYF
jgi:hypothetical protein